MKPRYKRRLILIFLSFISIIFLCVILIPPYINLNYIKPYLERNLTNTLNQDVIIDGDIHFTLIGHFALTAKNVYVSSGKIDNIKIRFSYLDIFNIKKANYKGYLYIDKANLQINNLSNTTFKNPIKITNSILNYNKQNIHINEIDLRNGNLNGTISIKNNKYNVNYNNNLLYFYDQNLKITGKIENKKLIGNIKLVTDNIKQYLNIPFYNQLFDLKSELYVDKDSIKLINIQDKNINGNIEIDKKTQNINLEMNNININLQEILNSDLISKKNTYLKLKMNGQIKLNNFDFQNMNIDVYTKSNITPAIIYINNIKTDMFEIDKGIIQKNFIKGLNITKIKDNTKFSCNFTGTFDDFKCNPLIIDDMTGNLEVNQNKFKAKIISNKDYNSKLNDIIDKIKANKYSGEIDFTFNDISGILKINSNTEQANYKFAKNKDLNWLAKNFTFLPKTMCKEKGDFVFNNNNFTFTPYSKSFVLIINNNEFQITGNNFKQLFPNIDLQFLKDKEYTLTGNFNEDNIDNLKVEISNHIFYGTINKNYINLTTNVLDLNTFVNKNFIQNFDELQFLIKEPLLTLFDLNKSISFSANSVIYDKNIFNQFVYSIKENSNTISVTDNTNGNILLNINKYKNIYEINIKLNNFYLKDNLLDKKNHFNIIDTYISGDINLKTFGLISYDIRNNLSGNANLILNKGFITNLNIDNFYRNIDNITKSNIEMVLSNLFDNGNTFIKNLKIIGNYDKGIFKTISPFELSIRHGSIFGDISINKILSGNIDILLRGISPDSTPITLNINNLGKYSFSTEELIKNLDLDFLQEFIKTHKQF